MPMADMPSSCADVRIRGQSGDCPTEPAHGWHAKIRRSRSCEALRRQLVSVRRRRHLERVHDAAQHCVVVHTGGQLDEPLRAVFREAFANADLPHFSPHSFRKTLARLGQQLCRSPEEYKAWSQNLGHEGVVRVLKSMAEKLIGGCRPRWRVLSKTW